MVFRSPYQAPQQSQFQGSWSEWQDLNLRPPRPERGTERVRVGAKTLLRFKASVSTRTLRKWLI
jgi:hypothetical protein